MQSRFVRLTPTTSPTHKAIHKALVFDMDGVLVNSEPMHAHAERITCASYGIDVKASFWKQCQGKMAREIFTLILEHQPSVPISVDELVAYKKSIFETKLKRTIAPIPGALLFVSEVRALFPRIALATSSDRATQQAFFARFHLDHAFDVITTGSDVRHVKPNPEAYMLTASKLGLAPAECLVIEDSPIGISAARAAGCAVIGIATGTLPHELYAAGAHRVARSYRELMFTLLETRCLPSPFVFT